LDKAQFLAAYQKGMTVIDARKKEDFAKAFIPKTINIEGNNSFSTWAGWVLDYDEQFMLIAEEDQIEDLTRKLMRIGLDNVFGYIEGIEDMGIAAQAADIIGYEQMKAAVGRDDVQILDVWGSTEYKAGHIPGADHIFVGVLQ